MSTIAIDYSRAVAEQGTGVSRYTQAIVSELIRLDSPHHFLLYTPVRPWNINPSEKVTIRELRPRRPFSTVAVSLALLRDRPDCYFSPSGELPLLSPCPVVTTVHDLAWRVHPEDYAAGEILLNEWVTRRISRLAAHVMTPSLTTRRDLIRCFDYPAARLSAIPYGASPKLSSLGSEPPPLDRPYLLAIGTHRRKRLPLLLDAFRLLKEERTPIELVIVGRPNPTDVDADRTLKAFGNLRQSVHLVGHVPEAVKSVYLKHAQALVFVSRYEGFGLPIVEAFAARIPVVLSRIPAFEEVAGSAALYLEKASPLELAALLSRLLHSQKLRMSLVSKGRVRLSRFSWTEAAQRTLEVFEGVLKK